MRDFFTAAVISASTLMGSAALAQTHPVVVELYTSQGCSSCPPADAMLAELASRDDVIALALHVDYWDYIGWKDDFANPAYTRRQQDYSHAAGATTIYTPQMVIGGVDHVIGSRPMAVADLVQAHMNQQSDVTLDISRTDDELQIHASYDNDARPMVVQLLRFIPKETREITRGENAGLAVDYVNIVHSFEVLAQWDGSAPLALNADVAGDDPAVVLIQLGTDGPIVAAAQLR